MDGDHIATRNRWFLIKFSMNLEPGFRRHVRVTIGKRANGDDGEIGDVKRHSFSKFTQARAFLERREIQFFPDGQSVFDASFNAICTRPEAWALIPKFPCICIRLQDKTRPPMQLAHWQNDYVVYIKGRSPANDIADPYVGIKLSGPVICSYRGQFNLL